MLKANSNDFFWSRLVDVVSSWGYDRNGIVFVSMPEQTLKEIAKIVVGNGLQIGGFVGISHCYLANSLKNSGTLCTIEANFKWHYIENPFLVANKLVRHFNLSSNSMLVCGYAIEQMNIFISQKAKFDFILLDGNHMYNDMVIEIDLSDKLLKPGGYLILDDIDFWQGPKSLYENFPLNYEKIPLDSRAGVLRKPNYIKI